MKKIIQLAILITIIGTSISYCWEWSDLIPNWYTNWRNRKQEIKNEKMRYYARYQIRQQEIKKKKMNGFGQPIQEIPYWKQPFSEEYAKKQITINPEKSRSAFLSNWYTNWQRRKQEAKNETMRYYAKYQIRHQEAEQQKMRDFERPNYKH